MQTLTRYIPFDNTGIIQIPKDFQDAFAGGDTLKLSLKAGKMIVEPVEEKEKKIKTEREIEERRRILLSLPQIFIDPEEIAENRRQMDRQIAERAL